MKKIFITLLLIASGILSVNAQVFNTGQTLKSGTLAIGINPLFYGDNFGSFFYGEYGIMQGMDMRLKMGLGYGSNYFGADMEWSLISSKPYISLTAGGHIQDEVGIDGTLNLSFPIGSTVTLYSGMDMDIVFANDVQMPGWIPIGMEVGIRNNLSILLEGDIGILNNPPSIFNGGLNFYF